MKSCYLEQMKQRRKTLHCVCRQHGRVGGWRTRSDASVIAIKTANRDTKQREERNHEKRWTAKIRNKA